MNKLLLPALLAISCLIFSCQKPHNQSDLITFDTAGAFSKERTVRLDEIAASIETLELETNDDALITYIIDIILNDKYIAIVENKSCLLFDRNGKFIRKVGSMGEGPEEFTNIGNVLMDEECIHVFDSYTNRLLSYRLANGEYVKTLQLSDGVNYLTSFYDGQFIGYIRRMTGGEKNRLLLFDQQGNKTDSLPYYKLYDMPEVVVMVYNECQFFKKDGEYYLGEFFNDTIFRIDREFLLHPVYVAEMGEHGFPEEKRYQVTDPTKPIFGDSKIISQVFENNRYFLFTGHGMIKDKKERCLRYDKQSGQLEYLLVEYPEHLKEQFEKESFAPRFQSQDRRFLIASEASTDIENDANPTLVLITLKE